MTATQKQQRLTPALRNEVHEAYYERLTSYGLNSYIMGQKGIKPTDHPINSPVSTNTLNKIFHGDGTSDPSPKAIKDVLDWLGISYTPLQKIVIPFDIKKEK
jgi:hypothetical protein